MKKLLVASAVALFGLSNAQIAKGTTYLSGTVNFEQDSDNNTNVKTSKFTLVPTVGYFVNTNFAIGLGVGYKNTTTKIENNQTAATTLTRKNIKDAFVLEPFARKYWTLSEKLYIFGQLSVPMEFGGGKTEETVKTTTVIDGVTETNTISETSTKTKNTKIGVAIKPGLDYFLNKNWTIEATIGEFGYNSDKSNVEGAKSIDNFKFGLNFANVGIGVKYVFSK